MSEPTQTVAPNAFGKAWSYVKGMFTAQKSSDGDAELDAVRQKTPAPVLWLFGKTQSGKSSLVRFLTAAEDAAIGNGFRPCTRTSMKFPFPTDDAPVLTFLDTRGVDEPGYDPAEDIAALDPQAHLMLVTCRIGDFATGNLRDALTKIRTANPKRPVVLVLTCLHEVYPQRQHPEPYPYGTPLAPTSEEPSIVTDVRQLIERQRQEFAGLIDDVLPVDLTQPMEGFEEPNYGGAALQAKILDMLPSAYRETLRQFTEVHDTLRERYLKKAGPVLIGYSALAATAGALPVPFVDLVALPLIQARMVKVLADLSGNKDSAKRFLELAATIGIGLIAQTALRQVAKLIPFAGSAIGGALAWASTYALGRAFLEYDRRLNDGHIPGQDEVAALYREHLAQAEQRWKKK